MPLILVAIPLLHAFNTHFRAGCRAPLAVEIYATLGTSPRGRFNDFHPLASPEAYKELLDQKRTSDDITVIKWASDQCRTCRAAVPKIRGILKKWDEETPSPPGASYYSVDLRRDNSVTMLAFFKARNITLLPCIELYVGDELLHTLVVPPSRTAFLRNALGDVAGHVGDTRRRRERRRMLLALRQSRRQLVRLSRARAKLQRRYRLDTLSATAVIKRERRRGFLISLRSGAAERETRRVETTRLERKRRLFNKLVAKPKRMRAVAIQKPGVLTTSKG